MKLLRSLVAFLSSFGLACILIFCLFLLTLFGTLYQVEGGLYEAQKRYFESWIVVQKEPIPLVLPGGLFCMGLLALNLLLGGLVRVRKSASTAGVIVVHIGIALLLASGFVKLNHSDDGHLTLMEGQSSDEFESYFLWEVAIWDADQTGPVEEHLIEHEDLIDLGGKSRLFTSASLPFDLELGHYLTNCTALPKGPNWLAKSPVIDGFAFHEEEPELESERNVAGLWARCRDRASGSTSEHLLWGVERHPATFESGGKNWALTLRHKRYNMPFAIRLEDFRKQDHPGMDLAKSFESDVTKIEAGSEQKIRIQMNEPLRHEGLVLFQSSWGPQDAPQSARLFSVFSVVRNPSDYWPLYSCILIAIGLILAFVPKLVKFVRHQGRERARLQPGL